MYPSKMRRRIACEAARMIVERRETDYFRARMKAARRLCRGWVKQADLPTNDEIREEIRAIANLDTGAVVESDDAITDDADARFALYELLLLPLEHVKQSKKYHPEGDALYHSLQVFDLAREELPYDEEYLLAALLHDVGKAIDLVDPIGAALESLGDSITPRTAWLIEHHHAALDTIDGTIGARAKRRLQASESYDELIALGRCDRAGRQVGVRTPDVQESLEYIRELGGMWE